MKEISKKEIKFIEMFCKRTQGNVGNICAFLVAYKNDFKESDDRNDM